MTKRTRRSQRIRIGDHVDREPIPVRACSRVVRHHIRLVPREQKHAFESESRHVPEHGVEEWLAIHWKERLRASGGEGAETCAETADQNDALNRSFARSQLSPRLSRENRIQSDRWR